MTNHNLNSIPFYRVLGGFKLPLLVLMLYGLVWSTTRRRWWSVLVQARPRHTFAYRSLLTVPFLSGSVAVPETTTTTHGAAATTNGTLLHVLCVFLDHRGRDNRRMMIGCACFIILANIATAASLPPLSNPLISQSSSYSTTCRTLDTMRRDGGHDAESARAEVYDMRTSCRPHILLSAPATEQSR